MIKDRETIGLKVEDIFPKFNEINVKVDSFIKIKFNAYINKTTVINNVYLVVEDTNERVPCTVKAFDDMVELHPKEHLLNSRKYKVCISKYGISDILGIKLLEDFTSSFYTDHNKYVSKPIISEPKNMIYTSMPSLEFSCECDSCIVEVSNTSSFNLILYSNLIDCREVVNVKQELALDSKDGLYFVRIKTDDNSFSDVVQFYLSSGEGLVSPDDEPVEVFDLGLDDEVILDSFEPSKIVTSENLKNIYYKFDGRIDTSVVDKCKHYIKSTSADRTNELIEEQGYLDYRMVYMYDPSEDKTYLIFRINEV